jgi:phosphoenolpyruvate carboxykinase (ATP)
MGVTEPTTTFSACFGKAFLPLHPAKYAEMLGEKLNGSDIKVWLVNTGWTGGPYGIGSRMKLSYTRAMITAAIEGKLDNVVFDTLQVFNLSIPTNCEGVPSEILNPRNTWSDVSEYDRACTSLANEFVENFRQFQDGTSEDILSAAPKTDTLYEREIL